MTESSGSAGRGGPVGGQGGHPDDDALVELALGVAPAPDALSAHLSECAECRAAYDDISRDVEAALAAGPTIDPPAGFESRALARLGAEPTPLPRRWPRRRRLAAFAVAAAVGLIVGIGGLLGVQALRDDPPAADTGSDTGSDVGTVALRTHDGVVVGRVLPSWVGDEEVLVLRIDDGPPGMHYVCRLRLDDDSTRSSGEWVVPDTGTATWITPSGPDVASVELVTDSGKVWSSASLG